MTYRNLAADALAADAEQQARDARAYRALQAVWPDGVIARYLTVGGATVDVTVNTEPDQPYQHTYYGGTKGAPQECVKLSLLAACSGCKDNNESEYEGLFATVMDHMLESPYGRTAQRWAQTHAETCRAMPKPVTS